MVLLKLCHCLSICIRGCQRKPAVHRCPAVVKTVQPLSRETVHSSLEIFHGRATACYKRRQSDSTPAQAGMQTFRTQGERHQVSSLGPSLVALLSLQSSICLPKLILTQGASISSLSQRLCAACFTKCFCFLLTGAAPAALYQMTHWTLTALVCWLVFVLIVLLLSVKTKLRTDLSHGWALGNKMLRSLLPKQQLLAWLAGNQCQQSSFAAAAAAVAHREVLVTACCGVPASLQLMGHHVPDQPNPTTSLLQT